MRTSTRVRIELDGVVLAEADSAVVLFETGLPPRYYLPRTCLRTEHLHPSDTVTSCPYKGTTSGYWSAVVNGTRTDDVAWTYSFPLSAVQPIAGMVAFYDEKVGVFLDDVLQERPVTGVGRR